MSVKIHLIILWDHFDQVYHFLLWRSRINIGNWLWKDFKIVKKVWKLWIKKIVLVSIKFYWDLWASRRIIGKQMDRWTWKWQDRFWWREENFYRSARWWRLQIRRHSTWRSGFYGLWCHEDFGRTTNLGSENVNYQMKKYTLNLRPDGVHRTHLGKALEGCTCYRFRWTPTRGNLNVPDDNIFIHLSTKKLKSFFCSL